MDREMLEDIAADLEAEAKLIESTEQDNGPPLRDT